MQFSKNKNIILDIYIKSRILLIYSILLYVLLIILEDVFLFEPIRQENYSQDMVYTK